MKEFDNEEKPEVIQENPKEINAPLSEPIENKEDTQNKKGKNKTGMCQIIYYDFSLK